MSVSRNLGTYESAKLNIIYFNNHIPWSQTKDYTYLKIPPNSPASLKESGKPFCSHIRCLVCRASGKRLIEIKKDLREQVFLIHITRTSGI